MAMYYTNVTPERAFRGVELIHGRCMNLGHTLFYAACVQPNKLWDVTIEEHEAPVKLSTKVTESGLLVLVANGYEMITRDEIDRILRGDDDD